MIKNEKVYIINKSVGSNKENVLQRLSRHYNLHKTDIIYKNKLYETIIGYYQRTDHSTYRNTYVIDYEKNTNTGDFYLRSDFFTENELESYLLENELQLDSDLFEI